jgi:hypothetical protein
MEYHVLPIPNGNSGTWMPENAGLIIARPNMIYGGYQLLINNIWGPCASLHTLLDGPGTRPWCLTSRTEKKHPFNSPSNSHIIPNMGLGLIIDISSLILQLTPPPNSHSLSSKVAKHAVILWVWDLSFFPNTHFCFYLAKTRVKSTNSNWNCLTKSMLYNGKTILRSMKTSKRVNGPLVSSCTVLVDVMSSGTQGRWHTMC